MLRTLSIRILIIVSMSCCVTAPIISMETRQVQPASSFWSFDNKIVKWVGVGAAVVTAGIVGYKLCRYLWKPKKVTRESTVTNQVTVPEPVTPLITLLPDPLLPHTDFSPDHMRDIASARKSLEKPKIIAHRKKPTVQHRKQTAVADANPIMPEVHEAPVDIPPIVVEPVSHRLNYPSFDVWRHDCNALPDYICIRLNDTAATNNTVVNPAWLLRLFEAYFDCMDTLLNQEYNWLETSCPQKLPPYRPVASGDPTNLYIQKLLFSPGTRIFMHGDLHGDVKSYLAFLQRELVAPGLMDPITWKILDPAIKIVMLGDYTDRGWCGPEVLATLLMLKLANPSQLFMVRGNHEDANTTANGGFQKELKIKFDAAYFDPLLKACDTFYYSLPIALYYGSCDGRGGYDFRQANHGGIEFGIDSRLLLADERLECCQCISSFNRRTGYALLSRSVSGLHTFENDIPASVLNGNMWSDYYFTRDHFEKSPRFPPGFNNVYDFGQDPACAYFNAMSTSTHHLRGNDRGHQHNPDVNDPMRRRILNDDGASHPNDTGVGVLWTPPKHGLAQGLPQEPSVFTFSVTPGCGYKWPFESYGIITLGEGYSAWRLEVRRIYRDEIFPSAPLPVVAAAASSAAAPAPDPDEEEYVIL